MERRNRSLEVLQKLQYIDSLEPDLRAQELSSWTEKYLSDSEYKNFDLELSDLKKLHELFFKNINFLKQHRIDIKQQLDSQKKIKEFLQ